MSNSKIITLHIAGTHCNACKHLIEDVMSEEKNLSEVKVSLKDETISFTTTLGNTREELAGMLTSILSKHNYSVHVERQETKKLKDEWTCAIVLVFVAILGFVLLEKTGLASSVSLNETTFTTAFVVGLVASVSTCLAVVGGLVLSVSATYAHEGKGWRPQALFHIGRLAGFFLLGGLLGALGEIMHIGIYGSAVLGGLVSVVMVVLGIHLLDVTKKVRMFTLPKSVSTFFTEIAHKTGVFAPVLLGVATFSPLRFYAVNADSCAFVRKFLHRFSRNAHVRFRYFAGVSAIILRFARFG